MMMMMMGLGSLGVWEMGCLPIGRKIWVKEREIEATKTLILCSF